MAKETIVIDVTQADIEIGGWRPRGPLVQAILRVFPSGYPQSDGVSDGDSMVSGSIRYKRFCRRLDKGLSVKPTKFRLTREV
jgi:hypothetical protein